jgi:hypothetical protein
MSSDAWRARRAKIGPGRNGSRQRNRLFYVSSLAWLFVVSIALARISS